MHQRRPATAMFAGRNSVVGGWAGTCREAGVLIPMNYVSGDGEDEDANEDAVDDKIKAKKDKGAKLFGEEAEDSGDDR